MSNLDFSILSLSQVIEHSLDDTLHACLKIFALYKEELANSPFIIDLLDDALRSERLKETAHSRILYRILHDENMQRKFVEYFLPNVNCSAASFQIPYPDRHRIDLTIKSDNFFLIIENKVNDAPEQPNQINKYVRIAQQTYPDEEIYVLYLGGSENIYPSEDSLPMSVRQLLGV